MSTVVRDRAAIVYTDVSNNFLSDMLSLFFTALRKSENEEYAKYYQLNFE